MLSAYLLVLGMLALLTAYTRNFQRTVVKLADRIDATAGARLLPEGQRVRTLALLAAWPLAIGLGMMFVAWWKAMALVAGAFALLVPLFGALTPRPESVHYVVRIREDLRGRIARGGRDAEELRRLLERLDRITGSPT